MASLKNLRLVEWDLADRVMKLSHVLQRWKIDLLQIDPDKLNGYLGRKIAEVDLQGRKGIFETRGEGERVYLKNKSRKVTWVPCLLQFICEIVDFVS